MKQKKQKSVFYNIETLYNAREGVIKFSNDYSSMISKAKYKTIYGKGCTSDLAFRLKI